MSRSNAWNNKWEIQELIKDTVVERKQEKSVERERSSAPKNLNWGKKCSTP